jgi:hypothetical protein
MLRKFIKTTEIEIDGRRYRVQFFEHQTIRGSRRFSCEVVLDITDRIILDDDSMAGLESKVSRLVPATVYSRRVAGGPSVAA